MQCFQPVRLLSFVLFFPPVFRPNCCLFLICVYDPPLHNSSAAAVVVATTLETYTNIHSNLNPKAVLHNTLFDILPASAVCLTLLIYYLDYTCVVLNVHV
jgi:hypothetical protein